MRTGVRFLTFFAFSVRTLFAKIGEQLIFSPAGFDDGGGIVLVQVQASAMQMVVGAMKGNVSESSATRMTRGVFKSNASRRALNPNGTMATASKPIPFNVVVISDRKEALLGSIGSLMLYTSHPTIVYVITRNQNLAKDLDILTRDASSTIKVQIVTFASVLRDLKSLHITPVWQWPEFGLSIKDPEAWIFNSTVHVEPWDNLTVHSNPMNLLRFYLPELKQFRRLSNLIFMDDDIIVKGDLARLADIHPRHGKVQIATCGLWKWGGGESGKCESFGLHAHIPLDQTDFMYMSGKVKQSPGYKAALEATIREVNHMEPNLQSIDYWNYGFVKMNLTEWRRANLTKHFEAWMKSNYKRHIFPEYSLSYGLGISQVMLMGRVQCWDEVNISISDGLGYVTVDDFDRASISIDTLNTSFVLHWSGTEKPFVASPPQSFRGHWNAVLKKMGVPEVHDMKLPEKRKKALLVTDTPAGSEWFMDLIDQHPRVCATKGKADAFPRESLITGDFDNLGINYCSRGVSCTWGFVSEWVPIFYRYRGQYCADNVDIALWQIQFPNAEEVFRLHKVRMCSWVDTFQRQNITMSPQSLLEMYLEVAFGRKSTSLLGCTCPIEKDIQFMKFVSDWWVGDQQNLEQFDPRLFDVAAASFRNVSRSHVRRDFRFKEGYLNRFNSPQLSLNFSNFAIVSFSRENIFEQYISSVMASTAARHPERVGQPMRINVDKMLHYIDDAVRVRRSFFKTLEREAPGVLHLTYEGCVVNPSSCVERVQAHLGVDSHPVVIDSITAALKDADVFASIANAGAVREALQEYGFPQWINSGSSSLVSKSDFLIPRVVLEYKHIHSTPPSYWWNGNSDRLIFLHIHRTGGSTLVEMLGGKDFPTVNVSGELIARHNLRERFPCLPDATCKIQNFAADILEGKDSCWNDWPGPTAHYIRRLRALQETNCRVVELHHFDITGAMPFVRNGFRIITIIREPLSHLGSRFEYELLRRWTWMGELDDETYNSTFQKFAQWTEYQSSPQQGLRFLTGCSNSGIADVQFDFLRSQIEDISPGLCSYEYLDGYPKFPITPSVASTMIAAARQVAREKVNTVLVFEAWEKSLALVSKKHSIPLRNSDLHLNALGDKRFAFAMLPKRQQRRLQARLLPDTHLYNLLFVQFAEDAKKHAIDLTGFYPECSCTEFPFDNSSDSLRCEHKLSETKVCALARKDGTCELDQVKCFAKRLIAQENPRPKTRLEEWEHAALSKLAVVFRAFQALQALMPWGQLSVPLEQKNVEPSDVSPSVVVNYSYERRPSTYCGGSVTRKIVGPTSWDLDTALSACDENKECLCVSMFQRADVDELVWELSLFGNANDDQVSTLDTLVWNPAATPFCGNSQEWIAGEFACFLRENDDWVSYRKNL